MRSRLLPAGTLAAAVAIAVLAGGCGSADDWSAPHAEPTAVGTLGPGFVDPSTPPSPEATITPRPRSWDGVRPSEGYRVVLLTTGDDPQTRTLVNAVTTWAEEQDVSLKTVKATRPDQFIARISEAIGLAPDLIVSAGNALVDPLALVTANHLDQQFLVVGAELAEPTGNVTAADWTGASFRGEGLGMSSEYDPATFTPERAGRAVRAGVAAVLHGVTGIVIWLD
ncbi:type 1 periplasmic-binding domain-containing protein [Sphaerisporangium aureirubrum]|uniref:BMP family ABC transporter substrate-binding protein n=1 Tax=Sphaerisporangium aureirubrum TaxID=1544736 RepID=A0ABW1NMM9_9ACTN